MTRASIFALGIGIACFAAGCAAPERRSAVTVEPTRESTATSAGTEGRLEPVAPGAADGTVSPAAHAGSAVGEASGGASASRGGASAVLGDPAANPVAYLRTIAEHTRTLRGYRLRFTRQERLGLVPTLRPREQIDARFRADPFSVYFSWIGSDSEYAQAAFVRGQSDDKVLLLPRKGLLGLPPSVGRFNLQDAVTFQKARNPITDFGLSRMMERTLKRIADAERHGGATVRFVGPQTEEATGVACRRFELLFPPGDPFPNKRMDLYIDAARRVPVGVYLWLPDGQLDAMYLYERVDSSVQLSEADFVIQMPDDRAAPSKKKRRARDPKSSAAAAPTEIESSK